MLFPTMKNVKLNRLSTDNLTETYPFNIASKSFPLSNNWLLEINYAGAKMNKIYNNINRLDDGIYTYVIYIDPKTLKILILFSKVNIFEFGTKHMHIDYYRLERHPSYELFVAGELKKINNKIYFNFESGTYTKSKIKSIQQKKYYPSWYNIKGLSLENYVKQIFRSKLSNQYISIHYTSNILINTKNNLLKLSSKQPNLNNSLFLKTTKNNKVHTIGIKRKSGNNISYIPFFYTSVFKELQRISLLQNNTEKNRLFQEIFNRFAFKKSVVPKSNVFTKRRSKLNNLGWRPRAL